VKDKHPTKIYEIKNKDKHLNKVLKYVIFEEYNNS